MLRIGMIQSSTRIGAFSANQLLLESAIKVGQSMAQDIVVCPELATCGYFPQDLLGKQAFIEATLEVDKSVLQASVRAPDTALVYGTLEVTGLGTASQRLFNVVKVVRNGQELGVYRKKVLSSSGLRNEQHWLEAGKQDECLVLSLKDTSVGFLTGDDLMADTPVVSATVNAGAKVLIAVAANAYEAGILAQRRERVAQIARKYGVAISYVNQSSGEEHAIYDGGSFTVDSSGAIVYGLPQFSSSFGYMDFDGTSFPKAGEFLVPPVMPREEEVIEALCFGLRQYLAKSGLRKVVVGCSGGLDSALTIALAARAIGPDNVLAVTMPSKYSSEGSVSDSQVLCERLGVTLKTIPIEQIVDSFASGFGDAMGDAPAGIARENLQARARGTLLMTLSNQYGYLLLATGNKSEASVGYFTLYGDSCGGLNLIGDLFKTEVYQLSYAFNELVGTEAIPAAILKKAPSAELAPGQKDEDSLPPYPVLDYYLAQVIEGKTTSISQRVRDICTISEAAFSADDDIKLMARVRELVLKSEFKRAQAAPSLRIKPLALGAGRKMPLTTAWMG